MTKRINLKMALTICFIMAVLCVIGIFQMPVNAEETCGEGEHSFTLPAGYDSAYHWDAVCEICGEKSNLAEHNIDTSTDSCVCGLAPEFELWHRSGKSEYFADVDQITIPDDSVLYLLKDVKRDFFSIRSEGSRSTFNLSGNTIEAAISIWDNLFVYDSYSGTGTINGMISIYSSVAPTFANVTFGEKSCFYLSDNTMSLIVENVVIKANDIIHPTVSDGMVTIISAVLENGIEVRDNQTLDMILSDGGYYEDESGNKITLAENQKSIEEKVYIKTTSCSVTIGNETTVYVDPEEAFDSIGAEDTATVKLLRDINRYGINSITVGYGNVTLDLAGHALDECVLWVESGVFLKVTDTSEEQSGRYTEPNAVAGIMVQDGALGIAFEAGNVYSAIYSKAPVVINGGNFLKANISVENDLCNVTINDGTFTSLMIYIITGVQTDVAIKGGTYSRIDLINCVLGDVLEENYLPMKSDGTYFSDMSEDCIDEDFTIVPHTHSYKLESDETYHFYICDCGAYEGEKEAHSGGEANCDEGAICDTCEFEYTEALEHNWDGGQVTTPPDCETLGTITYTCINNPDHTYTEEIEATGHDWDGGQVTTPPDCESVGTATYTCLNNPAHTYTEEIEATGHDWDGGQVTTPPDCESVGAVTYTCINNPAHTYTEEIEATGHDWDGGVVTKKPTCVEKGEILYTCLNNSAHTYTEELSLSDHEYKDFYCTVCDYKAAFGIKIDGSRRYEFFDEISEIKSYIENVDFLTLEIVLGKDAVYSLEEMEQLIFTQGKITLDLNGYRLEGCAFLLIGSSLTVTDTSEEQSGVLASAAPQYPIALLIYSSTLTVNGGSVSGIIAGSTVENENQRSYIYLNDGNFTVKIMGDAITLTVTGGEFTDFSAMVTDIEEAIRNEIFIYGGKFTNVAAESVNEEGDIVEDKLSGILLNLPCITYTLLDGSPEIDLEASQYTGTFTVSHDDSHADSESYEKDAFHHWIECENGVKVNETLHTYGDDGLCTVCSAQANFTLKSGNKTYGFSSFSEAIEFAKKYNKVTLTLYSDAQFGIIFANDFFWSYGDIEIDLNGHILSFNTVLNLSFSKFTVTDTSEENTGAIYFYYVNIDSGAEFILRDVNVSLPENAIADLRIDQQNGNLVFDGVDFSLHVTIFSSGELPLFVDVLFELGVEINSPYDLEYIFSAECLEVTDEDGEEPTFTEEFAYDGLLYVKHKETFLLTDWISDYDGTHSRYCFYCGLLVQTGECVGGRADCENGFACELCGEFYGAALGHVFGDDGYCEVCDLFAPLTVTAGEEKKHFFSAVDAFIYADGFASSSVTLNRDYRFREESDIDIESADVILELNGYYFEVREINIYGGSLTLRDSSAGNIGSFEAYNTLDLYNGSLIIESGNYSDFYIDLDPDEVGSSASLDIKGGYFDFISIETCYVGEIFVDISGGVFENLYFDIDYPAHISVRGGLMYYIDAYDGSYAYYLIDIINVFDCVKMLDDNGRRIYFSEEDEYINSAVRFVHDPMADAEAELRFGETHHWYECECGIVTEKSKHFGGKATCSALAVCEICDVEYGDYLPHSYDENLTCTVCSYAADGTVKVEVDGYTEYFDSINTAIISTYSNGKNVNITLLDNLYEEYIEAYDIDFVLDLNGYTLELGYMQVGDANIVITDTSAEKTGLLVIEDSIGIWEGNLDLSGGKYENLLVWMSTEYSGARFTVSGAVIEELYVVDNSMYYYSAMSKKATFEIKGGSIGNLLIAMSENFEATMTGGEITGGLEIHAIGDMEVVITDILPYGCYEFVNENGEKITDVTDQSYYSGYLGVIHTLTTEIKFDGDSHYNECLCGITDEAAPHVYDNNCDADCNVCGAERTPAEHVYENDCDADCNVCGAERTPASHVYDNACDASCNVCGADRTPAAHVYDNACDASCNVCGVDRITESHVYGDTEVVTEPTHSEDGLGTVICEVCGVKSDVVIPEKSGLSGGAVTAIAVGSTLTATFGGFSLFWFVIRKKSLAELLGLFK